jgi:DNA-binding ferritin-like protein
MEKWTPKSSKGKKVVPTFYEYYEETTKGEEEGVNSMSDEVLSFLKDCFTKTILREIKSSIQQQLDKGEITEKQMLDELSPLMTAMEEEDDEATMELISQIGKKYSMTISLLEASANGVPDDASSLFPE